MAWPKKNTSTDSAPKFLRRLRRKQVDAVIVPARLSRFADFMEKSPAVRIWVRLNQSLAIAAIAVATISFMSAIKKYDADDRKADEDRIAKAWEVVGRMSGKQSNGGQVAALERLASFRISLDHIDLHDTYVAGVDLHFADLREANLIGADLTGSNLQGSNLSDANLHGTKLVGTNLAGADMSGSDMSEAKLMFAHVDLTVVMARDLRDMDLTGATLVFQDQNGEDIWDSFSDSLAEARDVPDMQKLLDSACADAKFATPMNPLSEVKMPKRRCKSGLDYNALALRWSNLRDAKGR